jgi:hypothetical protein
MMVHISAIPGLHLGAEASRMWVQGQPWLYSKTLCQKINKKEMCSIKFHNVIVILCVKLGTRDVKWVIENNT